MQEPRVDVGRLRQRVRRHTSAERGGHSPQPLIRRIERKILGCKPVPLRRLPQQRAATELYRAHRLLQRCLEAAVYRHHLARRLHLRADGAVAARELVERPAGRLDDAVVQCRLERGFRALRHRVRYLVQPPSDRDLGRNPCDRVARRFGCQSGRPAHARVHLDDEVLHRIGNAARQHLADDRMWRQPELDVAPTLDAERADDADARGAEHLVFLVRERLARRDDDAVSGVDAHRVQVFHVAYRDARVGSVAHHFVLDLAPAAHRALHQHLVDGAGGKSARDHRLQLLHRRGESPARAAQRIRRPHHQRQTQLTAHPHPFLDGVRNLARRRGFPQPVQQVSEEFTVLRRLDRLDGGAEQPDVVPVEYARLVQGDSQVQPRLASKRRQ